MPPEGPSKPVICQALLTPGRFTGFQKGVLRSYSRDLECLCRTAPTS